MLMLDAIGAQLRAFASDRRGIAAVYTGVVLVVLAGAAGLGADAVSWELAKQKLQGAADQAAYSSVIGVNDGLDGYKNAEAVTTQLGYTCSSFGTANASGVMSCTGPNGVTLNVNHPAQSGKYANVSDSWEVIVQQTQPMWFTKLFMSTAPVVAGRAVALQQGSGNVCILALDTNVSDIHSIFGNQTGTVTVGGKCQVADNLLNNNDTDSVDVKSGAILNFQNLSMRVATKCDSGSCQGTLTVANPIQYNQGAIVDPYATRAIPTPAGTCSQTNLVITTTQTLNPDTYCGTGGNAAISVSVGSASLKTSSTGAQTHLAFTSTAGVAVGMVATDATHPSAIPTGDTVTSMTATSVVLTTTTLGGPTGLANKDIINFTGAGGVTVTLNPGVYILNGEGGGSCTGAVGASKAAACNSGDFDVTNGAAVTGSGATIVLTTSTVYGYNVGNMLIDDNSALNITAPTSSVSGYPVAGIAIWQNPLAPEPANPGPGYAEGAQGVNTVGSGSTANITGLIYFPTQAVVFSGGAGSNACTQILAWAVQFLRGANFSYPANCPATAGVQPIGGAPALAE
jgi:hypothetical protein